MRHSARYEEDLVVIKVIASVVAIVLLLAIAIVHATMNTKTLQKVTLECSGYNGVSEYNIWIEGEAYKKRTVLDNRKLTHSFYAYPGENFTLVKATLDGIVIDKKTFNVWQTLDNNIIVNCSGGRL